MDNKHNSNLEVSICISCQVLGHKMFRKPLLSILIIVCLDLLSRHLQENLYYLKLRFVLNMIYNRVMCLLLSLLGWLHSGKQLTSLACLLQFPVVSGLSLRPKLRVRGTVVNTSDPQDTYPFKVQHQLPLGRYIILDTPEGGAQKWECLGGCRQKLLFGKDSLQSRS